MQYDFSLVANGGQDIAAVGSYIKYKSGLGAIRIRMSGGGYVDLTPGQGIRMNKPFIAFNITDRSGSANAGIILAGDYEFQDDSINGAVSIIDGGKQSTLTQRCFMGSCDSGTVGAQYNYVTLVNDAASGKNVVVESVLISVPVAGTVYLTLTNAGVGAAVNAFNKAGNLAPVASAKMGAGSVTLIALIGDVMMKFALAANTPYTVKFAEPVIIVPNRSLSVVNGSGGAIITANFEFREDPL
jgi:hypothetical protein